MKKLLKIAIIWCALIVLLCSCENGTSSTVTKTAPNAPTGLSAISTDTTITVSWNEVSGAVQYHVFAGTTTENLTRQGSPTATTYLIQGLTANTAYYIAVSAENETGEGKKPLQLQLLQTRVINRQRLQV